MVIYLGSLVQLCCGEGGTLQTNITGLCGEYSQCLGHTAFAPAHSLCAFPVYSAWAPGCSAGQLSKAGPGLRAFPRSMWLRFWRRQWHPTPVLLPGKSHGRRSLVGCSPWGREESDTTERLHFHFHALEKEMATHSSVLAWRIPGMVESGGLPSVGSHRVRHD